MKNYFLHVEKEKNFDQAEINIIAPLKNNNATATSPAIIEKTIKNFVNKNIVELLDEIYLNNSISKNSKNPSVNNNTYNKNENNEPKIGTSDLNLKFFIAKNFLKENNFAGKFFIEFEKLKDIRQDEKLNKIMRKIKNVFLTSSNETTNKTNNYAVITKENDLFLIEKNLKAINAEYKTIDKGNCNYNYLKIRKRFFNYFLFVVKKFMKKNV
jgi:hypothetical protein